ncbi:hypothetical protein DB346_16870 [Verrucomicrobia bacterium LW23]|nr:hypothetical protein DB346_16870 [Verrucomicrobia bacterium LW23]
MNITFFRLWLREEWGRMWAVAMGMLFFNRVRCLVAVAGVAAAFFLGATQAGLVVGWCRINSAIILNANVDVWVMARQTASFDFGTAIPRQSMYRVRSIPEVRWAEAMLVAWNTWQRADGRRTNILLIGLDDSNVGGPWQMQRGVLEDVQQPDSVIVDELYADILGVRQLLDRAELTGRRAVVRGISEGVRTFTASPFVFTSIKTVIAADRRYRPDEITYVMARGTDGQTPEELKAIVSQALPELEVITSAEFANRTIAYWMLETGAGFSVVLTGILGLVVGTIICSQTLYTITAENLGNYATLSAIGFGRETLICVVAVQSLFFTIGGIILGTGLYSVCAWAMSRTQISIQMNPEVYISLVVIYFITGALAATIAIRAVLSVDPATVFSR